MKKSLTRLMSIALVFMLCSAVHAAQQEPIIIKFTTYMPSTARATEGLKYFAEELEKRTSGRVKVNMYWSQSLVKVLDTIDAIKTGLADAGQIVPSYTPDKMPLAAVAGAPFCMKGYWAGHKAFYDLYNDPDFPAYHDEFTKNNLLILWSYGGSDIDFLSTKPLRGVDDLKGKKVRSPAHGYNVLFSTLGWVPVSIRWEGLYEGLMRGTVDAALTYPALSIDYKFVEVAKHHTKNRFGNSGGGYVVFSLKLFESLPKDIQKIILDLRLDAFKKEAEAMERVVQDGFSEMEKRSDITLYKWSDAEVAKLMSPVDEAIDKYLTTIEKKGHPAKETFKRFQQHQAKYLK